MENSQEEEPKRDRAKGHPEKQEQNSWPHWSHAGSFKNKAMVRASALRRYDENAPVSFWVWQYKKKKIFFKGIYQNSFCGVVGARMPARRQRESNRKGNG